MAKQNKHAAEMPQDSEKALEAKAAEPSLVETIPPAIPESVLAEAPPAAAAPTQSGWIDLNKPMSIEDMHRASVIESPFLACNF
jgi:hypothetical protein